MHRIRDVRISSFRWQKKHGEELIPGGVYIAKQLGEKDFGCGIINMGLVVGLGVSKITLYFVAGLPSIKKLTASLPLENGWDWSG